MAQCKTVCKKNMHESITTKTNGSNKSHYTHFSQYPKTSKEYNTAILITWSLNSFDAKP